jgi:replication factor C small subunit
MGYLKEKDFGSMRKWVAENSDNDQTLVFRKIYDALTEYLPPKSIPQAVLILGDYQYKAAFVADPEINMVAFMTELMMNCEFKA